MTKGKTDAGQDGNDPFSLRKHPAITPTQTSPMDAKKIAPSNEHALMSKDAGAHSSEVHHERVIKASFTKPEDLPEAPTKPVAQPQGIENTVPPQLGYDHVPYPPGCIENAVPPQLGHDRVPYPPGWFTPPGMGPRFHGYPGPPFFSPYGGWGMFSEMDPSGAGPSTLPAGAEGQNRPPFDPSTFFKMYGQRFMCPNGFIPRNVSGAGTSEGGQVIESEAASSDTK